MLKYLLIKIFGFTQFLGDLLAQMNYLVIIINKNP